MTLLPGITGGRMNGHWLIVRNMGQHLRHAKAGLPEFQMPALSLWNTQTTDIAFNIGDRSETLGARALPDFPDFTTNKCREDLRTVA